jgi:hypothetical protein
MAIRSYLLVLVGLTSAGDDALSTVSDGVFGTSTDSGEDALSISKLEAIHATASILGSIEELIISGLTISSGDTSLTVFDHRGGSWADTGLFGGVVDEGWFTVASVFTISNLHNSLISIREALAFRNTKHVMVSILSIQTWAGVNLLTSRFDLPVDLKVISTG